MSERIKKQKDNITIRSSAAEYLTFVASTGDSAESIEMRYEDENIWLTQKMMAELYNVDVRTINYHIGKVFEDSELEERSTIRKFRIVQSEGSRQISREVNHYNLQMIIAVGFKVNNERAVQFRKWANAIVKDYTIKGWVMDEERLKNGGTVLTEDELYSLERIVSAYLDLAEDRARRRIPMTMEDWAKRLDIFLMADDREILTNAGTITAEIAKAHAESEFEKYRIIQDRLYESDYDRFLAMEQGAASDEDGQSGQGMTLL